MLEYGINSTPFSSHFQKVGHHETPDWVNSIAVSESRKDSIPNVVLGCLDNSILSMKITENLT